MVDIDKLCPGCMQHLKDSNTTCPHCGYPEKRLTVKDSLPIFSILAGKYLLGAPLGKGGFGITYIAMHLPDEKSWRLKNFFRPTWLFVTPIMKLWCLLMIQKLSITAPA